MNIHYGTITAFFPILMTNSVVKGPYIFHSGCEKGSDIPPFECDYGTCCGSVRKCSKCSFTVCYAFAVEINAAAFAYRESDGGFCNMCNASEFADLETMFDWGVYAYKAPTTTTTTPATTTTTPTTTYTEQTTMANFSSTEVKPTLTISQDLENTKSANKPITKAPIDDDDDDENEATGLATNHFFSIIAFSVMFVQFFLNA